MPTEPITDADLEEMEAMSASLGDRGFPLKMEVIGLVVALRSARAELVEATDSLLGMQRYAMDLEGMVKKLTSVAKAAKSRLSYGHFVDCPLARGERNCTCGKDEIAEALRGAGLL